MFDIKFRAATNPEDPFANMCWENFSLELGQLDPRHEKSMRCLSIILATILLSSNPKWPPLDMTKI